MKLRNLLMTEAAFNEVDAMLYLSVQFIYLMLLRNYMLK
jgi:hypothetical protein